jgi:predicted pyridoxine 5'-phosphate oxidase superfamily flavin-nucleotide-binding protein
MNRNFTRFAFTQSVKKAQERYGTRHAYARMEKAGDRYVLTDKEAAFIQSRDSFYMATVGENGWPYVQFRGGPKGFLKVIDATTLGYADFRGNGQYISTGNIESSHKAALILMDYSARQRLKIWAEATIMEAEQDADLMRQLTMPDYDARIERLVLLDIQAWDWNCPQHITPRYTIDELKGLTGKQPPEVQ